MVWELALRSLPNCWQEISLSLSFISAWVCSDCFLCFRPMFQRKRTPKHNVNILESLVFSALECLRLADSMFSNATFWGKEPKQPPSLRMLTHWHLPPGTKWKNTRWPPDTLTATLEVRWIEAQADAKVISSAGSRAEASRCMSPFNVVSVYTMSIYVTMSPKFIWLFDLRSSVCTLYTFARSSQQKTLLNSPLRLLQSIYLRVYVQICVICSRTLCLCKADKFKAPRYGATKDSGRCLKPVRGSSHL